MNSFPPRNAPRTRRTRRTRRQPRPRRFGTFRPQQYTISSFPRYTADQPTVKLAKLQYTCIEALPNITAGTLYQRIFRANDLYDPDYAVGGHQPYGFDQLIAQYYHFTVLYSSIELELTDAIEYKNSVYRIWRTDAHDELTNAFVGGPQSLIELPNHSEGLAVTIGDYRSTGRTVTLSFDGPRVFNRPANVMVGDADFQGSASASPTEDCYFIIAGYHPTGAAVTYVDASIRVTITYYAVFTEPKRMTAS